MNTKENESGTREKEYIQQVVYNKVLYLPVPKLKIKKQGATISDIVKEARIFYDNGNPYSIDINDLTLLEICLKEESDIPDIGNVTTHYASFNKDTNDLIAYGITRQEADSITDAKATSAVVFIYKGSERQGIKEDMSMVFRETPRTAWSDSANMEGGYAGHFQEDGFTYERISSLGRASLLNVQDTLRQIEGGDNEAARVYRQFMRENKLALSTHSQGRRRTVTARGVFPELQSTRCYVFDAPGIPLEY